MKNKSNIYLPNDRAGYEPKNGSLISKSENGTSTKLPNTVEDPIVVNNISYSEFDYTETPYDDSELEIEP